VNFRFFCQRGARVYDTYLPEMIQQFIPSINWYIIFVFYNLMMMISTIPDPLRHLGYCSA